MISSTSSLGLHVALNRNMKWYLQPFYPTMPCTYSLPNTITVLKNNQHMVLLTSTRNRFCCPTKL